MKKEELEKELEETKSQLEKTKTALKKSRKDLKEEKAKAVDWNKIGRDVLLCAWVGGVAVGAQFIVGYPMLWILGKSFFTSTIGTTIYSALVYVVTALIVIFVPWLVKKEWKTSKKELGLTDFPTFTDIGISILGFIATILISGIVLNILQVFNLVDASQTQDVGYSNLMTGFDRAIAFISLVVVAPFAEEVIFRGWLYGKLKTTSGVVVATILTALVFGTLHGQWNVGITVAIMSVIVCIERELTGTIHAGILTHMLKNGVAFGLLVLSGAL